MSPPHIFVPLQAGWRPHAFRPVAHSIGLRRGERIRCAPAATATETSLTLRWDQTNALHRGALPSGALLELWPGQSSAPFARPIFAPPWAVGAKPPEPRNGPHKTPEQIPGPVLAVPTRTGSALRHATATNSATKPARSPHGRVLHAWAAGFRPGQRSGFGITEVRVPAPHRPRVLVAALLETTRIEGRLSAFVMTSHSGCGSATLPAVSAL